MINIQAIAGVLILGLSSFSAAQTMGRPFEDAVTTGLAELTSKARINLENFPPIAADALPTEGLTAEEKVLAATDPAAFFAGKIYTRSITILSPIAPVRVGGRLIKLVPVDGACKYSIEFNKGYTFSDRWEGCSGNPPRTYRYRIISGRVVYQSSAGMGLYVISADAKTLTNSSGNGNDLTLEKR